MDLNYQLFQVAVKLEDKVEASAAPAPAATLVSLQGALFVELGFEAAQAQAHSGEGVLSLELSHIEVRVGQVHVSANGTLPVGRRNQEQPVICQNQKSNNSCKEMMADAHMLYQRRRDQQRFCAHPISDME